LRRPENLARTNRRRKSRFGGDWKPVHAGQAFQDTNDYSRKMLAQALYYDLVRRAQARAASFAEGRVVEPKEDMKVAPQTGPLYTDMPCAVGAQAGIGQTAFLEYRARLKTGTELIIADAAADSLFLDLFSRMSPLRSPQGAPSPLARFPGKGRPSQADFKSLCRICSSAVFKRIVLRSLAEEGGLGCVDTYRMFQCAQFRIPPLSTKELVDLTVLMGDLVMPALVNELHVMHPAMARQLNDIFPIVTKFEGEISPAHSSALFSLGRDYAHGLVEALAAHLPPERPPAPAPMPGFRAPPGAVAFPRAQSGVPSPAQMPPDLDISDLPLAPLDAPPRPSLRPDSSSTGTAKNLLEQMLSELAGDRGAGSSLQEQNAANAVTSAIQKVLSAANDEKEIFRDPRPDRLQNSMANDSFERSAIEGNPSEVTAVTSVLGAGEAGAGSVFSEVLLPSPDPTRYQALVHQAGPITQLLRKMIYPNRREEIVRQRFRSSGNFDPSRMHMYPFSDAIYRTHQPIEKLDSLARRPSVILVCCDGSGSMGRPESLLLKILLTAFAESLSGRRKIVLLAGIYHSGSLGRSVEGPMVRWLHHPLLTPAVSPAHAARAIASFPEAGTGVNRDIISITYMIEEARTLARGGSCYVVNLTDTQFNSCTGKKSGEEEMKDLLAAVKELPDMDVHYTVVALGRPETYKLPGADKVICVPSDKLNDTTAVAEKIAQFVGESIRENRAHGRKGGRHAH